MLTFGADQIARLYGDNTIGVTTGNLGAALYANPTTLFVGGGLLGFATEQVDEVAIWSRVLTSDERPELWAAGAGKFLNAAGDNFE
jgi:hypothetical protein